jgi:hypothetical protein
MNPAAHCFPNSLVGRLLLGLAFGAALPAYADDTTLTGDWGGLRRALDDQAYASPATTAAKPPTTPTAASTARRATRRTSSSACSST